MNEYRYIIRSRDRVSGTQNNCLIGFKNPVHTTISKCFAKVVRVSLSNIPIGGAVVGASHALDVRGYAEICSDLVSGGMMDTEKGCALKPSGLRNLVSVPYSRLPAGTEGTARLMTDQPWFPINNLGNFGAVNFSLWSDTGIPLQTRNTGTASQPLGTASSAGSGTTAVQTLVLTLSSSTTGPSFVGDVITGLGAYIRGEIVVAAAAGTGSTTLTIGFPAQIVPVIPSTSFTIQSSTVAPETLNEWEIELLLRTE